MTSIETLLNDRIERELQHDGFLLSAEEADAIQIAYTAWKKDDAGADLIAFVDESVWGSEVGRRVDEIQRLHGMISDLKRIKREAEVGRAFILCSKIKRGER